MNQDECIQILMDLGLRRLEARAYLALSKTGTAKVRVISKTASIARQDTYRILSVLQKLGLAEKVLATPTMYKATPIKEGYSLLLQNAKRKHIGLQEKTTALIKSLSEDKDKLIMFQEAELQFVITSSRELVWKKLDDGLNNVLISVDACAEWKRMRFGLFRNFEMFQKAMKRGTKIRLLTEEHEDNDEAAQRIIQTLKKDHLFEIRYLSGTIPIKVVIHDGKEVNLCLEVPPGNTDVPSLWSDNPQFAKVYNAYFEELWKRASS